jgi:hypothetical protein
VEIELAERVQLTQAGHELAAKHSAEHFHREKESVGGANPACMVWVKSTSGNYAMHMRMKPSAPTIP